jgi:hypothetical protein
MTKKSTQNYLLEFTKAITLLVNTQETFKRNVETLQDFVTSVTADLDTEIRNKHLESESLKVDFENMKRNVQIEIDQEIAESKRAAIIQFLSETDEVPIQAIEFKRLNEKIEELEKKLLTIEESTINKEKEKAKTALSAALTNNSLKNAADMAQLRAVSEQQEKEIKTLENLIRNQKEEIACQRELTKQVAQATSNGQIQQHIGKQ